jgi:hypothetical protein
MICAGLVSGCVKAVPSDDALVIGLRKPIDELNRSVVTQDLSLIRGAARKVIATYDAAVGPR